MLQFLVKAPDGTEREVTVEGTRAVAGRDGGLDLVLGDAGAEARHFEVSLYDRGAEVRDLGTAAGTRVNGSLVAGAGIDVGDMITVGDHVVVLLAFGGPAPARRSAKSRPATRPPPVPRQSGAPVAALLVLLVAAAAVGGVIVVANSREVPAAGVVARTEMPPPTRRATPDRPVRPGIAEPAAMSARERALRQPWLDKTAPIRLPEPGTARRVPPPPAEPEEARPPAPVPVPAVPVPDVPGPTDEDRARTAKVAIAREALRRLEESLADRIAGYRFDGPSADLASLLEGLPPGEVQEAVTARLADLEGAGRTFALAKRELTEGSDSSITLASGLELRVTGVDDEGFEARKGPARMRTRWVDVAPGTIHEVAKRRAREPALLMDLAAFAALHGLEEDAEEDLRRVLRLEPELIGRISAAIARYRNEPFPSGGYVLHEDEWVTKEEKGYLDQGLVEHEGRWMTKEEAMVARGYTLHEGRWLSPEDYEDVLEDLREKEELAKKYMPKGLIDKPGHGEAVEWGKALELKTRNYRIRTNLGRDVLQDVAYTMEILRTNLKSVFGLRSTGTKFTVSVAGNREQYGTIWPMAGRSLGFCSATEICTFYQPPMTTSVLMHEGTHQMVRKFESTCPRWLHEGLATYFECSRFSFDPERRRVSLDVGLLNANRLQNFQAEIRSGRAVSLETFLRGQGGNPYHQGWGLVYYLAKGEDGRYAKKLHEFIGRAGKGDAVEHFQKIFRVRDLTAFETQWIEYVKGLDPKDGVTLAGRHQ